MNKSGLLPKLAINGMKKNGRMYLPYLLITSFAVFAFFIFSAICDNAILYTLPHAFYIKVLMENGRVLLAIILVPILVSTNKFLMKQRKSELGLYNVLGLDRKYIAVILFFETLIIYGMTMSVGILIGVIFSKLIFLLLMNISGLPIDTAFSVSLRSVIVSILFFGAVALYNLYTNLWHAFKAKPIELMRSSKEGEKKVRFLGMRAVAGCVLLAIGYTIAMTTEIDSMIFINFFVGVLVVIWGTLLLFKSGTIALLNRMKNRPQIYYKKDNYVTISGMLYRMKRNAQSLANICIFSTMILITLICTVSLFVGQDEAIHFNYPLDAVYQFNKIDFKEKEAFVTYLEELAQQKGVTVENAITFDYQKVNVFKEEDLFYKIPRDGYVSISEVYTLRLMTIASYNEVLGENLQLQPHEVLIFSKGKDFGYDKVRLGSANYAVKEELQGLSFERRSEKNIADDSFYIIMPTWEQIEEVRASLSSESTDDAIYTMRFDVEGDKEASDALISELTTWSEGQVGFRSAAYIGDWEKDTRSMNGGLLFLGVFFGIIFSVCLVLLMYYKQISEGYEDQRNFKILQQVGMSDKEVKGTIRKQILVVFFLPLIVAVVHTFMALHIVGELLAVLYLYNETLIWVCSGIVILIFGILYAMSYSITSKVYYKIVK